MQEHPSRGTPLARHRAVPKHKGIHFRPLGDGQGGVLPHAAPYAIAYRDTTGKAVGPIGTYLTIGDAEVALRAVNTRKDRGERVVRSKVTVAEALELLIEKEINPYSEGTKRIYRNNAKNWINPVIGRKVMSKVDGDDILNIIDRCTEGGLSGQSVDGVRSLLSKLYRMNRLAASSPLLQVLPDEWPEVAEYEAKPLEPDEVRKVLDAAKKEGDWLYYALFIAIYTGMRSGEIRGLLWENIDFSKNVITLTGQIAEGVRVNRLKSKKEGKTRPIGIHPDLRDALLEWRSAGGATMLTGYVFPSPRGEGGYHSNTLWRRFKDVCKDAGVDARRVHDTRHTFLTFLGQGGTDLKSSMVQSGHADEKTALRYQHVTKGRDLGAENQRAFENAGVGKN